MKLCLSPLQRAEWKLTRSQLLAFVAFPLTWPLALLAVFFALVAFILLLPSLVICKAAKKLYDDGCVDWNREKIGGGFA